MEVVRQIKGETIILVFMLAKTLFIEKACYITSASGKEDQGEDQQREYQLPDGEKIFIGNSKFKAPEILFKPDRKWIFS